MKVRRPSKARKAAGGHPRPAWLRLREGTARAGFTLIEVTLALTLVGLIAALVLPRVLPNTTSTALRIKAFEVAALLRADRNTALRTGRVIATDVDLLGRRVWSSASGRSVGLPAVFTVRLTSTAPSGFRFFPDGTSSGGELILSRPDSEVAVRVNDVTAAISVHRGSAGRGG